MNWMNILKDVNLGNTYLNLGDGKELTTENLEITLELKEVSGKYRRKTQVGGDKVSDNFSSFEDARSRNYEGVYGEYEYAFMPKLKGFVELYDGDILVKKFKAEEIGVSFEGGSFNNIKTFPVPIIFEIELDYDDEVPFIYITMQVA